MSPRRSWALAAALALHRDLEKALLDHGQAMSPEMACQALTGKARLEVLIDDLLTSAPR